MGGCGFRGGRSVGVGSRGGMGWLLVSVWCGGGCWSSGEMGRVRVPAVGLASAGSSVVADLTWGP